MKFVSHCLYAVLRRRVSRPPDDPVMTRLMWYLFGLVSGIGWTWFLVHNLMENAQ